MCNGDSFNLEAFVYTFHVWRFLSVSRRHIALACVGCIVSVSRHHVAFACVISICLEDASDPSVWGVDSICLKVLSVVSSPNMCGGLFLSLKAPSMDSACATIYVFV